MTLEIRATEVITIQDVFGEMLRAVKRLFSFAVAESDKAASADITEQDDNKSPPDLGVSVSERVQSGESLG